MFTTFRDVSGIDAVAASSVLAVIPALGSAPSPGESKSKSPGIARKCRSSRSYRAPVDASLHDSNVSSAGGPSPAPPLAMKLSSIALRRAS
eukprot:31297-Pelagococcus_subviridis.AAC.8